MFRRIPKRVYNNNDIQISVGRSLCKGDISSTRSDVSKCNDLKISSDWLAAKSMEGHFTNGVLGSDLNLSVTARRASVRWENQRANTVLEKIDRR